MVTSPKRSAISPRVIRDPQEDEGQGAGAVDGSQGLRLHHRRSAFIVATLVYMTSPDYMMILFTDPRGHLIMGCSAVWMSIGIFVMRNMINFDI